MRIVNGLRAVTLAALLSFISAEISVIDTAHAAPARQVPVQIEPIDDFCPDLYQRLVLAQIALVTCMLSEPPQDCSLLQAIFNFMNSAYNQLCA
ncbi:MAG: hypothetical protein DCC75_07590 [Proteobacteria bacterium]|nr:MAG: hypothetical protein DCC75_07590 [Pseudomonadota bacterium]